MIEKNKSGGGAKTTENGNVAEDLYDLGKVLIAKGFDIVDGKKVYREGEEIGIISKKKAVYGDLFGKTDEGVRKKYGVALEPDTAFVNFSNKTLYIIEVKSQTQYGSVDEKLQTCEFKLRFYNRLMWDYWGPNGEKKDIQHVRFIYILSEYFKNNKKKYKEVLRFIQDKGCDYYFGKIELCAVGLYPKESK